MTEIEEKNQLLSSEGQRKGESFPQSAASLGPESLAVAAALCQNDSELADTVIANSDMDFVVPSPTCDRTGNDEFSTNKDSPKKDVAASVQSFLRSQDVGGLTNAQLTFDEKMPPLQPESERTVMNLTAITPATEIIEQNRSSGSGGQRSSLTNFMHRLSNQYGNSAITPSGARLPRQPFATTSTPNCEVGVPKPILPISQSDLPQLLKEARSESSTISITSSGCSSFGPFVEALKKFCNNFTCRQTSNFLVKSTTHVVLRTVPGNEPNRVCDRTMKFLLGVAAKRWVVSIQWVLDSIESGTILPEENYEITGDMSTAPDHMGPSKSRTSRTGLFNNIEICLIHDFTNQSFTKEDVFQLIEFCGGTRIDSPDAFSYKRGTKRVIALEEPTTETGQTVPPTAEELKRRKGMLMQRIFSSLITDYFNILRYA